MSTDPERITHYRIYAKAYGTLIAEAADDDQFILDLINNIHTHPLLTGLRQRIEESESFEGRQIQT